MFMIVRNILIVTRIRMVDDILSVDNISSYFDDRPL